MKLLHRISLLISRRRGLNKTGKGRFLSKQIKRAIVSCIRQLDTVRLPSAWRKPQYESLEDRSLLAVAIWTGAQSGDWNNQANWAGLYKPQMNDTVVLGESATRKDIFNVQGQSVLSALQVAGTGYVLSGSQSLSVVDLQIAEDVIINTPLLLGTSPLNTQSTIDLGSSVDAQFSLVTALNGVTVLGPSSSSLSIAMMHAQSSFSVASDGVLEIQSISNSGSIYFSGSLDATIHDGATYDGTIHAAGGTMTISGGNFATASIMLGFGQTMDALHGSIFGNVIVSNGANLFGYGSTTYGNLSVEGGGTAHTTSSTDVLNASHLDLASTATVNLQVNAQTGNLQGSAIFTNTAQLGGTLNLVGNSKISKYEQLPLITGTLTGTFSNISSPNIVDGFSTLDFQQVASGLVATGLLVFVNSTADAGVGTLRDAIDRANQNSDFDHIYFDLPSGNNQQIVLSSELPWITQRVYLHGLYAVDQQSSKASPWVGLNGSQISSFTTGLALDTNQSTIQGLSLTGFSIGLRVLGSQNDILGNYLGARTDGSFAANQVGVSLVGSLNQIGSGLVQDRNYFVACEATSIEISSNSQFNQVFGNWIGLGPNGESSDNSGVGVSISNSQGNVIGTNGDGSNDELEGNVLSGNSVGISLNYSTNTRISGNKIGTSPDGDSRMQNRAEGISSYNSSSSLIGTNGDGVSDALERNIISGNNQSGIFLHDSSQFRVAGNYIGTTATGLVSLGNNSGGITMIGNSHDNVIGTDSSNDEFNSNERNLISGNQGVSGIGLSGSGVSNNVIAGNWIGLSSNGSDPLGNSIGIDNYNAVQTRMGTNGDGFIDAIESNIVSGNSIGINLTSDSPWLSDIFTAEDLIAGRIQSATHTANLAVTDISDATFPSGSNWAYDSPVPGGGGDNYAVQVTGTIQVAVQGIYSFAAGSDDGTRLRIDGTIVIDYPYPRGFGVSYGQIELSAGDHTFEWISYEQGGAAGYELSVSPIAGNTSEITEANGWKVLGDSNPHSEIQIKPSTSMTANAYYVTGGYKLHASIAGNYIGTDPSGTSSIANGTGVNLGGASTVSIGGAQSSMRNVISGNQGAGISGYVPTDIAIQENLIGLNGSGQESLGNGYGGIDLYQPSDLYVKNNVISSNQLGLQANNPNNAVIIGNIIGLAADGLTPRPNTTLGLGVFQGANVRIGTDGNGQGDASEGNLVSANGWTNIYFSGIDASIAGNIVGTDKNYGQLSNIPVGNGITLQYALNVRTGTDGSQDTYNSAERNVVSGNNGDGISVDNSSTITIAGNLVGVSPEDMSVGNANTGVRVNNSQNVVIGTNGDGSMDQIEGNVSSGNNVGIAVFGQQSSGNRISGNTVGTNMAGTSAFPNLFTGIWLWYSDGTIVGTDGNGVSDDLERNVSSGNVGNGVSLEHASNNRIAGNYLGTSADGLLAIPNSGDGIRLVGRMTGNIIGTDSSNDNFNANERNLISGNNTYGIATQSSANKNIVIAGNWIGLDATGNAPLPNKNQGVWVENSTEVRVGTDGDGNYDALERNVVSGNLSAGIGFYTGNAQVYGIPMVAKLLSGQVPTIQTSGMIAQADLSDASNPENGVWNYNHPVPGGGGDDYAVVVTGTIDVASQGSYSFALSGSDGGRLRIDGQTVILDDAIHGYMSVYGHVELTAGPHSFEWIGFERDAIAGWELSVSNTSNNISPVSSANGWKVLGDPEPHSEIRLTPNTPISVTTYKVNGFEAANLSIAGNYVGTNASGDALVPNTGYGIYGGYAKNFTLGGSNPAMANLVGEIRVDNATDFNVEGNIGGLDKTGAVALGAGEITSYDSSQFQFKSNLIGSGGGIWIHRGSDAEVTGNSVGFAADGVTPRPAGGINVYDSTRILIGTDGDGQNDAAEGNLVGATYGRSANINLVNSTDIAIAGNVIGANKNYTAIAGLPTGVAGIHISDSSNIRIGTDGSDDSFNASERNVIAGNTSHGIAMGSSSNSTIAGNLIGLTPSSVSLANAADGVFLENTTGVIIGTNADGQSDLIEGNVVSGNNGFGVKIQGNGSSGNRVAGNLIGTSINGLAALGNSYSGVEIRDASTNNIIGGSSPVERNIISGNTSDGIRLIDAQTSGNIISGNFIGTTADGLSSLPNAQGISLQSGASNNRIGLSSNYVTPANLLVNGDIEAPAIVGVGQTQVGLGGSKWTTQVSTASDYGGAISGISGWSYAATEGGSTRMHTDIGIARIDSQFRKNSTGQAIYANRWDKLISQTVPNTFTSGTTITAEIDFSTVGSLTDAGRGTYFYLVAGEANPTNLDQLSSRSIVLAQMTAANPTWTSFTPDVVVPINEPRRLTLRYTFQPNDPALNLPLTIAVRLAGGSVGPGYYDNASLTASTANPSVIPEYGNLISGNSQNGILVEGAGSTGNVIAGNWIGTNTNGTAALANGANGIRMLAPSNTIGTDGDGNYDYLERNVVSGNSGVGIVLSGTNVTSGVIAGNIIGMTSNATAVLGNQAQGILIESGATSTRIGTNGDGYSDVAERNYISGNAAGGIWIKDSGTQSHVIAGNYIGTDQWGQLDRGNTGFGVQVSLGATNTIIGTNGTNDAYNANESNVISGNSTSGVVITGVATNSNAIAGNYIGLRAGGRLALANDLSGIMVSSGAMFNRIGTDGNGIYDTLERNVISGNNSSGVEINGVGTSENNVAGNFIGTDSTGLLDRGNNAHGVHITNSQGVSVSGNIISGNNGHGVLSQDDSGTILQSNYVGLDVTGNNPLGNSSRGVFLERTSNATVGGNATGSGNTIAANLGVGLFVDGGSNNWIAGNLIGTNASGNSARPNLVGIQLSNGASYNRIGSNGDGTLDLNERNIISGNRENGVVITGGTSVGNSIAGNRIGTDISGTNALANELSGIYNAGSLTQIGSNRHDYDYPGTALRNLVSGNLQSGIVSVGNASSYDETYSVWIAHNDIGLNASGNGLLPNGQNGVRIIDGSIAQVRSNVISGNNSAGLFGANLTTRIMATGNRIGTDSNGMIDYGNNSAGVRIENVPYARLDSNIISGNSGSGVEIIGASHQSWLSGNRIGVNAMGTQALPNDQNGVLLSGTEYTQIGAFNQQDAINWGNIISGNKESGIQAIDLGMAPFIGWNAVGTNSSGTQAISNKKFGILAQNAPINAFSNTVSGNISGGIALVGSNTRDSSLRANTIGLNALGNAAIANGQFGVYVGSGQPIGLAGISDAWRNRIGDSTSGDRNIISGNNGPGVWIAGTSSKESVIEGNYVGTDRLGQLAIPNTVGVLITDGANLNIIGGPLTTSRNLISGNATSGVILRGAFTVNNIIRGNWIGTDSTGSVALANQHYGIQIAEGAAYASILSNVISGNVMGGILIQSGGSNTLRGNWIGTDSTGTLAVGNGRSGSPRFGVKISAGNANLVGGIESLDRNVISGNFGDGLVLADGTYGNSVQGNAVGTNISGEIVISNTANGILLDGDSVVNNTIGGAVVAAGNLIYNNLAAGLRLPGLTASTASQNVFDQNLYQGNLGLAIDIGQEGVTANDVNDTDSLPNAPGIVAAFLSTVGSVNSLVVQGYTRPGRSVQFYVSAPTASGRGQGTKRLASLTEGSADDTENRTGNFPGLNDLGLGADENAAYYEFTIPLSSPAPIEFGDLISAIAVGSTSEFGNIRVVGDVASNQPPQIALPSDSVTIAAGDTLQLSGSFVDTDSTRWTATVDYGDGSAPEVLALSEQQTFTLSHRYDRATDGSAPYRITLAIVDNGGKQSTATIDLRVSNVAPTISASDIVFASSVNEGSQLSVTGTFSDTSSSESHTVSIEWGDGTTSTQSIEAGVYTFSVAHTYTDDNPTNTASDPAALRITVSDSYNASATADGTFVTTVMNVQPTNLSLSTDLPNDPLSGKPVVFEGSELTLSGNWNDPGLGDSHRVVIDWGDGSSPITIEKPNEAGQTTNRSFSASYTYANNPVEPASTYSISVSVADDDEPLVSDFARLEIQVQDVAPSLTTLSWNQDTIQENGVAVLNIAFTDPGVLDTHRLRIDWGDGTQAIPNIEEVIPTLGGRTVQIPHKYLNNRTNDEPYSVSVEIVEIDPVSGSVIIPGDPLSTSLVVTNVAPSMTTVPKLFAKNADGFWNELATGSTILEGTQVKLTGTYSDVGTLDTHSVRILWSSSENLSSDASVNSKDGTFEAYFTYADDYTQGTSIDLQNLLVLLSDNDGATAMSSNSLLVQNVDPDATFIPNSNSTTTTISLQSRVVDPGVEVFSYYWHAIRVASSDIVGGLIPGVYDGGVGGITGTTPDFTFDLADPALGPSNLSVLQVTLIVSDDDLGSDTYVSSLFVGSNGDDTIDLQTSDFASGVSNLTVLSFDGSDVINASALPSGYNVILDGGAGQDRLIGGPGNDTFILRDGNDIANQDINGDSNTEYEQGDDTYLLSPNSTLTVIDRSGGNNTLDFSRANIGTTSDPKGITFDLSQLTSTSLTTFDVGELTGQTGHHFVRAQGNFNTLVGSSYGDDITGRTGSSVFTGAGADAIKVAAGTVGATFNAGADADVFTIGGGTFEDINFEGDSGADVFNITGTSTFDQINFSGDSGADVFNLGGGFDGEITFSGGADADVFTLGDGVGAGTIIFSGGADADVFTIGTGSADLIDFRGDSGADVFDIGGVFGGDIIFSGGADADVFTIGLGGTADSIDFNGDSGADVFTLGGDAGTIIFTGGADADVFTLGSGGAADSIDFNGDSGADVFNLGGDAGTIIFTGGADADVFTIGLGGTADNIDFNGDSGADVFNLGGDAGTIIFSGGADADVFTLGSGGAADSIDFNGDSGADVFNLGGDAGTIIFTGGADADVFTLGSGGSADSIDFNGDSGADVFNLGGDAGTIIFTGGADVDVFTLGSGGSADSIDFNGDSGADVFNLGGDAGTIIFTGGADADVFTLGSGGSADSIDFNGDSGADVFNLGGDAGTIIFTGGADADVFTLGSGGAADSIDFNGDSGADVFTLGGDAGTIIFTGGADADVFVITSTGSTDDINFEGDSGADVFQLGGTVGGDIIFTGGADADVFVITVTGAGDTIDFRGDAGDDTLSVSGAVHAINYTGGEGSDRFRNNQSNLLSLVFYGFENPSSPQGGSELNDGDDVLYNYGSNIGSVSVRAGRGKDVLYSSGNRIDTVSFEGGADADVFILTGTDIDTINFGGGADADVFDLSGVDIGSIDFRGDSSNEDAGDDVFINRATGKSDANGVWISTISFTAGGGMDTFRNDSSEWKEIFFQGGDGADRFQNNAQDIETIVFDAGQADDYFENNADNLSGIVFLGGSGNDAYVNRGNSVSDLIFFGDAGDDQFFNYGTDVQGVWYVEQSGTNRMVNRGDRTRGMVFQGGSQSDTLINSGATVSGIKLIGNAGADRFLNDTSGVGASDLLIESTGSIPNAGQPNSFTWPTIVSPSVSLPSIPSATVDDGVDWVFNRAASVQSLVFYGDTGDDYFQNSGGGLTDSEFHGGSGNDTVLNTSGGTTLSSFVFYGSTGNDAMQNDAASAHDVTFFGNEGNDSLYQNGVDFEAITFDSGDGTDIFVNWGAGGSNLRMIAGSGDDRYQNNAADIDLLSLDAGPGDDAFQNNGDGIVRIEMLGDSGSDTLLNSGNSVTHIWMNGGSGDDSLVNAGSGIGNGAQSGTTNTGITFEAGDGLNVLRTQGINLSTLVYRGGSNSDTLVYNTTEGGSIDFSGLGGDDGFLFRGSAANISVNLGSGQDRVVYSGTVDSLTAATPTVLIDGGAGDDNYQFLGTPKGYLQLTELYSGVADTSRDMLDFSAYLGGLISIDLASATKQSLGSGFWLQVPVDSLMGIEDVRGSQAGDTIFGNDRPNVLMGARYLSSTPGDALARNRENQWVLLDFDTKTDSQEYVYTDSDRESVIEGLRRIYYGYNSDGSIRQYSDPGRWFNVRFTTDIDQIPKDSSNTTVDHVVIRFNNTPPEGTPGGSSSEIDVGNTGFSGEAWVQVHGLLGGTALAPQLSVSGNEISGDFMNPPSDGALTYGQRNPDNTVPNFLALSVKIAAHELAHLMGLRHYDAFGPIGSGVHTPPGNSAFSPAYTGVSEAFETFSHLISSPASVGSDRKNDIGNLFFGEREAIKLSYVMSDPASTRSTESLTPTDRHNGLSQDLAWKTLAVPNTIGSGQNSNANLYAEILSVTGQIEIDPVTGRSEDDRYSFTGRSGDIVTVEVSSRALKRFTNLGGSATLTPDGYIDSRLSLLGSNGDLVGYYESVAFNDDEFESSDSILLDVVLPSDGSYTIVVDSFTRGVQPSDPDPSILPELGRKLYNDIINDTDVGNYELFVYRFARENARDVRNTLVGRGGVDTYIGTTDENYAMSFPSGAIPNAASTTESAGLTITIPFNDTVGTAWTATMDYNNDGVVDETLANFTPGTGLVISHLYSDNGTYSLSFVISNEDGSTLSGQFPVTVSNSQPTSTFNTQDAVEGSTAKLTAIGSDSTGDIAAGLRYYIGTSFLLRNAATYATSSPNNTYQESFSDSITRELYVRVMDKDGGFTDYTTTLVVENVAPTATISNSGPVAEGTPVLVELSSVIDPSSVDTVAGFRYSFARSMSELATSGADSSATTISSKSFVFDDDSQSATAPWIVYARVFDKDNGYSTYQTTISVTNANPTASIVSITTPAIVDQSIVVSVDGSDPAGANDPLTYLIEVLRNGSVVASSNSSSKELGFTPTQTGTYTARVTAYDDDGGVSAVDTEDFQVRDPLTLVVNGPADGYVGVVGQLRDFSLLATSPGSSGIFNYSIDWKDGSGMEPLSGLGGSYTVAHRYLTVGTYAPVFTVTDSLGRTTSVTLTSFTIGLIENQGSFVAIAGDDRGSQSDTVSIEALNSTGQFRATINNGTPFDFSATGVIRVFSDGNSDQLNVFGTAASDLFVVDANSIALNTTWSVQMPSASSRRLSGLDGNDNFKVDQSVAITLEGGNGSDTIESTGGISTNTWTISGLNSGSLRVGTETIDRIVFASTESLVGRDGQTDVYLISGGTLSGSIDARGTGDQDQLRYTSGAGFVNLANRQTSSVLGGFLGIESFASNAGRFDGPALDTQWTLSGNQSGSLSYLDSGVSRTIVFSGFGTLYGGAMADRFLVGSSGQSLGIFGGSGIDTLIGPSNGATWDLSGANVGNLMGTNPFSQFENLQGSDGVDRFIVRQAASISGRIDAGLGANILDYSYSTSAVVVDLRTEIGSATRIGSVLDRFSAVVGGTAADTLRASNTRGMLVMGTGGNDLLYGGNQRDVLVGGLGLDRLEGGSGEDIVIGGRTTFDTNLTAMVGVLSEWTRTGSGTSLEERYNNLSNVSPSASRLNGSFFLRGLEFTTGRTLNDDNAVDQLFGQADTDWFVGGTVANDFATTDYTTDQKKSTAYVNVI